MTNQLSVRLPRLAANFPTVALAKLPTPVSTHELRIASVLCPLAVKHDEQSGPVYGGNKVRKLEYLLRWALERGASRIATYGAAGSNHALATALYARRAGLECTCLLSQQPVRAPQTCLVLGGGEPPGPPARNHCQMRAETNIFSPPMQHVTPGAQFCRAAPHVAR
jgi:hypothetical protein